MLIGVYPVHRLWCIYHIGVGVIVYSYGRVLQEPYSRE